MTDAERLLAIEDIKRLMSRRIRVMDTKDWALSPWPRSIAVR
jgi:hypothetical protein